MVTPGCRLLPVLLFVLALAGCSAPLREGPSSSPDWEQLHARLRTLSSWQLRGRLEASSASGRAAVWVRWKQEGETYSVHLLDPLGRTVLHLQGSQQQATVLRPGQEPIQGAAEGLLQQALGWPVPVSQLRYWLLGMPAPGLAVGAQRVAAGALVELQQRGWHLRFDKHRPVQGLRLPLHVQARRGLVHITLKISFWQL